MTTSATAGHVIPSEAKPAPDHHTETSALAPWPAIAPSLALNIIAVLLVFWALYFAASLLVPIAAAVLLSMMLAPIVRFLEKLHAPRPLASALVVLSVVALLGAGLLALADPAKNWIEKAPQSLHRIRLLSVSTALPC